MSICTKGSHPKKMSQIVEQAGAELGQAQVELAVKVEVIVEVAIVIVVECHTTCLSGWWSDKKKLMLNSTIV